MLSSRALCCLPSNFSHIVNAKVCQTNYGPYVYTLTNKLSVPLTVVTIVFFVECIIKQLLDSVFVISRIYILYAVHPL